MSCAILLLATVLCSAPPVQYGPELIANGGFEVDEDGNGVADGWTRSVQMAGARAEVALQSGDAFAGELCLRIRFLSPDRMTQARVIQCVPVEPGLVYELAYSYRSAPDPNLNADLLLTGTGPLYRSVKQSPIDRWARKRILFLIPESVRGSKPADIGEVGQAAVLVQNRSMVPIWYDDISLRATDIPPERLDEYKATLSLHPKTTGDAMIFPDAGLDAARFIPQYRAPAGDAGQDVLSLQLGVGDRLTSLGTFSPNEAIRIPVESIPYGQSKLLAMVLRERDGKAELVAEHQQVIERFSPEEFSAAPDLSNAPALEVDGKPFFPIGMYGVQQKMGGAVWQALADHGFNAVHDYAFESSGGGPEKCRAYLDHAAEFGLKVIAGLPRDLAETGRNSELEEWVRAWRDHPNILFYYADEMVMIRHAPISQLGKVRSLLRRLDPGRPFIPFDKPEAELLAHTDGLMIAGTSKGSAVLYRARLGAQKPWISVPNVSFRDRPAPSAGEQRWMTFMPVILGARGVFYWMYSEAKWHSGDPEYIERLLDSGKELSQVAPAIISGAALPPWMPQPEVDGEVSVLRCATGDTAYILAGPSRPDAQGALHFRVPDGCATRLLFESDGQNYEPGSAVTIPIAPRRVVVVELRRM